MIRSEIQRVNRASSPLKQKFTLESLINFEWKTIMAELDEKLPTLMCALRGLLSTQRTNVSAVQW